MTRPAPAPLLYAIAPLTRGRPLEEARALARSLELHSGSPGEETGGRKATYELPGVLWGYSAGADFPGDRLTETSVGEQRCVLRGDPVWTGERGGSTCDSAALLRAWKESGPACFAGIDNLSVALVADPASGELHLATDRLGGLAVYTAEVTGHRVYSTSYLAISRLVADRSLDGESLACFFHLGYFPGLQTALRAVTLVPFGSILTLRDGEASARPYWRPDMRVDPSQEERGLLDLTADAFNATVREYSAGRDRMLLALTAGLDSRSVAASLLAQKIPFEAYTHGFPDCWEGRRVSAIVKRHGLHHQFVPLVETFTDHLEERALESFAASEGTISAIEKSHLLHVQSHLRAQAGPGVGLLLGGGAGMLKGTFYRLIKDEPGFSRQGISDYLTWNFTKKLPDIFSSEVPAPDRGPLHRFVERSLEEAGAGTFYQRLDYLYGVRYRRWAGGVKQIYRRFFPVREPFVSARLLDVLFRLDPKIKKAQKPHYRILERNYAPIMYDLTNKMTPALPFNLRTFPRFLPSVGWKLKQVMRGFSRRFLKTELFPLVDYVDYARWIGLPSGRKLVEDLLDPAHMRSAAIYDRGRLEAWLEAQRRDSYPAFPLLDKMCTLELYFREISSR